MRVLLLNPPPLNRQIYMKEVGRCGRKSAASEVWPQTGLAHIAAVLEQAGHAVQIIDGMVGPKSLEEVSERIESFRPNLAVLHVTTPTANNDAKVCEYLKANFDILIGLLGTHPSALPGETLRVSRADFVIMHEAEHTLREVAAGGRFEGVAGICHRRGEAIIRNPERPLIENLDELPLPARHLLENDRYRMPFCNGRPFATIICSRGCNYHCIFCRAHTVWGGAVRMRSPENVLDEIKNIVNHHGIDRIAFMADTFTINRKWTLELCRRILEEQIEFKWLCNSRVDSIDAETVAAMKEAGCVVISFGIESGCQEILDRSKKGARVEAARSAVALTKKSGIVTFGYYVLGLPGETRQTIRQTIRFAKEVDTDFVNFHIATPFPGTEFYDMARTNGWLITDDWERYDEHSSAVITTCDVAADELLRMRKLAMRQFYLRPSKILKTLAAVRWWPHFADIAANLVTK